MTHDQHHFVPAFLLREWQSGKDENRTSLRWARGVRGVRRDAKPLPPVSFAKNGIGFHDPSGVDHDVLGGALKKAISNDMHGIGLEEDVRSWLSFKVPKTTVQRNRIERALRERG